MPVAADDDARSIQPSVGAMAKDGFSLSYMLGECPGVAVGGILDGEQAVGFFLAEEGADTLRTCVDGQEWKAVSGSIFDFSVPAKFRPDIVAKEEERPDRSPDIEERIRKGVDDHVPGVKVAADDAGLSIATEVGIAADVAGHDQAAALVVVLEPAIKHAVDHQIAADQHVIGGHIEISRDVEVAVVDHAGVKLWIAKACVEDHVPVDPAKPASQRARKDHVVECLNEFLKFDLCERCHSAEPSLCPLLDSYGCADAFNRS